MTHELEYELGFSREEIAACLDRQGLLSLELEFTKRCTFAASTATPLQATP